MSWLFPKGKKIDVGREIKKALGAIPESQRNEAGSVLIAQMGGIEAFLDTLPPGEKARVVEWARLRKESVGGPL